MPDDSDITLLRVLIRQNEEILHRFDLVATKSDLHEVIDRLERLEEFAFYGNGEPGAKTTLNSLKDKVTHLREDVDAIVDKVVARLALRVIMLVGLPLLLTLIGFLAKLILDMNTFMYAP